MNPRILCVSIISSKILGAIASIAAILTTFLYIHSSGAHWKVDDHYSNILGVVIVNFSMSTTVSCQKVQCFCGVMVAQLSSNHIYWVLNLVKTMSFDSTTFGYLHENQVCFNIGVAPVTKPNINSIERALCSFTPLCSILSKFLALCGISVIVTRHQISKNIF